jgi:tetratricopeptide (TPR) repeat protein
LVALNIESNFKIGRNESCICGSGKKYKTCCLGKSLVEGNTTPSSIIEGRISEAGNKVLSHEKQVIESAIITLKEILKLRTLNKNNRINALLCLCKGNQHLGHHQDALDTLDILNKFSPDLDLFTMQLYMAQSFFALGYVKTACDIHDEILLREFQEHPLRLEERKSKGMYLLEAGKAYLQNEQKELAICCWEESAELLEEFKVSEIEHYQRAKSNLAFQKLHDEDESTQEEGVSESELYIKQKLQIGDLQGAANNFCNLGAYFYRKKRFGRAIAYYRKDLYLSELTGNKRDIAITLGNISMFYIELKQLKKAKDLIWQEKQLSIELNDAYLKSINESHKSHLDRESKKFALEKIPANEKAICLCNSNKLFIDCCGRADFEPVKMPQILGGISEDLKEIEGELSSLGITSSPLDFIFRNTPSSKARRAWSRHKVKDGWLELSELPDMANIHFNSAKEMARLSSEVKGVSHALSAIILSICGLEAFINQISFFLSEHQEDKAIDSSLLPESLIEKGAFNYQKTTSLEVKWQELSDATVFNGYLKKNKYWPEIKDLIYIRNELVHFKSNGYEEVVPQPRVKLPIYNKIPKSVSLLDEPHSWPFKMLNEGLANWATMLTEQFINDFKDAFQEKRRNNDFH